MYKKKYTERTDIDKNAPTYNMCTICGEQANLEQGKAIRWDTRNGGVCDPCVVEYRTRGKKSNYTSDYLKKKAQALFPEKKDEITVSDILRVRSILKGESNI